MKTIKQVLDILKQAPSDASVHYSYFRCVPTVVDSWRGIYAEAALGWAPSEYTNRITAQKLIKELEDSFGRQFTGWKGGEYCYYEDTPLHIDNPGECTNTEIDKITFNDYSVTIHLINE